MTYKTGDVIRFTKSGVYEGVFHSLTLVGDTAEVVAVDERGRVKDVLMTSGPIKGFRQHIKNADVWYSDEWFEKMEGKR